MTFTSIGRLAKQRARSAAARMPGIAFEREHRRPRPARARSGIAQLRPRRLSSARRPVSTSSAPSAFASAAMSDRTWRMELSLDAIGSARAVLIAGPTASGKSALALRLAEELARRGRRAWIVNADAMQVYDGLRVLTARPSARDEARVPHRLYGHVSPAVRYSVGAWLADIGVGACAKREAAGALVIVVGGTGLYFKALTRRARGDSRHSGRSSRALGGAARRREGVAALHALLAERDPASAAALRPSDPQRVLRALEVFEVTGRPLQERQQARRSPAAAAARRDGRIRARGRTAQTLYRRIEERVDRMVARGRARRSPRARRARPRSEPAGDEGDRRAGILRRPSWRGAARRSDREGQDGRRVATRKRQDTWFRHQMRDWRRLQG